MTDVFYLDDRFNDPIPIDDEPIPANPSLTITRQS